MRILSRPMDGLRITTELESCVSWVRRVWSSTPRDWEAMGWARAPEMEISLERAREAGVISRAWGFAWATKVLRMEESL